MQRANKRGDDSIKWEGPVERDAPYLKMHKLTVRDNKKWQDLLKRGGFDVDDMERANKKRNPESNKNWKDHLARDVVASPEIDSNTNWKDRLVRDVVASPEIDSNTNWKDRVVRDVVASPEIDSNTNWKDRKVRSTNWDGVTTDFHSPISHVGISTDSTEWGKRDGPEQREAKPPARFDKDGNEWDKRDGSVKRDTLDPHDGRAVEDDIFENPFDRRAVEDDIFEDPFGFKLAS